MEHRQQVTVFTRSPQRAEALFHGQVGCVPWPEVDPANPWPKHLAGAHALVHLAGEPIARRWTRAHKERIRQSRVEGTRTLVAAMTGAERHPSVFVSASAVGYYGAGELWVDEASPPGKDFLADVVQAWEAEALKVANQGVRVVTLRTGMVLGTDGGALPRMLLPYRLFAGGPIGPGTQWISWIHWEDLVGLILFALHTPTISGPMNGTAPNPVTMNEFAVTLGRVLRRPSFFPVPSPLVRFALGAGATVVLDGQRVRPGVALSAGYSFTHATLEQALRDLL